MSYNHISINLHDLNKSVMSVGQLSQAFTLWRILISVHCARDYCEIFFSIISLKTRCRHELINVLLVV